MAETVREDVVAWLAGMMVWSVEDGSNVSVGDPVGMLHFDLAGQEAKIRSATADKVRHLGRIARWTKEREATKDKPGCRSSTQR